MSRPENNINKMKGGLVNENEPVAEERTAQGVSALFPTFQAENKGAEQEDNSKTETVANSTPQDAVLPLFPQSQGITSPNDSNSGDTEPEEPEEEKSAADIFFEMSERLKKRQEEERWNKLFEKPPVFEHHKAREPITDHNLTFLQLQEIKSEEFSEFDVKEKNKKVTWYMTYGPIKKTVVDKDKKIYETKKEIEESPEFREKVDPKKKVECKVTAIAFGGNKGVAGYIGYFQNQEEAEKSPQIIKYVPSKNGKIYEIRADERGSFCAPSKHVIGKEITEVEAGFKPAFPRIPLKCIWSIIGFFRACAKQKKEALAYIEWRKEDNAFSVNIPEQEVSKMAVYPKKDEQRDGWIRIAEIHSHHDMKAFFSEQDDADEQGTGLYTVMGDVNRFFPSIRVRISVNGSFHELHPSVVIEMPQQNYPKEWLAKITVKSDRKKGDTNEIFQEYAC